MSQPRTVLLCHPDDRLDRVALARWLASFTDLVGVVEIHDRRGSFFARIKHEIRRNGVIRLLDVVAFRTYYSLFLAPRDAAWFESLIRHCEREFVSLPDSTSILQTQNPNSPETEAFLTDLAPDIVIARCKHILKRSIYSVARTGTFVMHPGICPEYRNSHGCFWALARRDLEKVGMTLLKVDDGVDTGAVYGYFYCKALDERRESHAVIQARVVFDNLDEIRTRLLAIQGDHAATIDTSGRPSRVWGQPWLTAYFKWKLAASKR